MVILMTMRRLSSCKGKWHCLQIPPLKATPKKKKATPILKLKGTSLSYPEQITPDPFFFPFSLVNLPSYKSSPVHDTWVVGTVVYTSSRVDEKIQNFPSF